MKGLTLFEALISILIFTLIASALGYAVVAGKSALLVSDIPTELRQNVIFALMSMAHELRQSAPQEVNISEGNADASITFRIPLDNDGDGEAVDAAGNIEWSPQITYALDSAGQLIRTSQASTAIIAPNISAVTFTRLVGEDALLQIDVAARKEDARQNSYQDAERLVLKMRN